MKSMLCVVVLFATSGVVGALRQAAPSSTDTVFGREFETALSTFERGHSAEARPVFESLRSTLELRAPDAGLDLAAVLNVLVAIDTQDNAGSPGWYERTERSLGRVVELAEGGLPSGDPDRARTLEVASILYARGNLQLADATHERWLELASTALGSDHPKVVTGRLLWGIGTLMERGELTEAKDRLLRALKVQADVLGEQHPDVAGTLLTLANVGASPDVAMSLIQRAVAIRRASPGQPYSEDIRTLAALINLQARQGRPLEEALLVETVEHRDRALQAGPMVPSGSRYRRTLEAFVQALQTYSLKNMALMGVILVGDRPTARHGEALFNLTIAAFASSLGRESPVVAQWLRELAKHYRRTGRSEEARSLDARATSIEANQKTR